MTVGNTAVWYECGWFDEHGMRRMQGLSGPFSGEAGARPVLSGRVTLAPNLLLPAQTRPNTVRPDRASQRSPSTIGRLPYEHDN